MSKKKKEKIPTQYYMCDFETTVDEDQEKQTETAVWAAAIIPLYAPNEYQYVKIMKSIDIFMFYITQLAIRNNVVLYFHNLSFDGSFVLNYLQNSDKWRQDSIAVHNDDGEYCCETFEKKWASKMANNTYRYMISEGGEWYNITLKTHYHVIEIRDSFKLLPFSVEKIGKDFNTGFQKLDMKYEGDRYPGCRITPEEWKYIAHDLFIPKIALQALHEEGYNQLTIGACALKEFKSGYKKSELDKLFPDLYEIKLDGDVCADEWIRKAYHGGWCYVVPEIQGKEIHTTGTTADVNGLYSYVMHSMSGNRYPIGEPTYWRGEIPPEALQEDKYYYVHVKTRFKLKPGMLPTIQIKNNVFYPSREWLRTSNVLDRRLPKSERYKDENRKEFYIDHDLMVRKARPDLYLSMTDWKLLQEHYDLSETEIIDGVYFDTAIGLFDNYINKWAERKATSTGAKKQISKLFLNSLSGKFAASRDSGFKIFYLNDRGELRSYNIAQHDKRAGYIAIGAAITSYGRDFIIRHAQLNYRPGEENPGFLYSDTDSCHISVPPEQVIGCPEDKTRLGAFKYEATWDHAKFVRQKTYIEHVFEENREPVEPHYKITCAGMSDHCKEEFIHSLEQDTIEYDKWDSEEIEFMGEKHTLKDFDIGLVIPGMLKAHNIKGGVLLKKQNYIMHETLGD